MGIVCLVDRSLIVSGSSPEVFDLRNRVVAELAEQANSPATTFIAYSEVARVTSLAEAIQQGSDFVYGSNLQHALLLARVACRVNRCERIALVTYSLPSAFHSGGDPFFSWPPVPITLEAAHREAESCRSDGYRIETTLISKGSAGDSEADLTAYFRPLTEATGGKLTLS
jgi:uncharacterized protein with von Willebrand factor type A (vWA) domain